MRTCVHRMLISCNVSTCVSYCTWFVGVVNVQPVMIRRVLFCIVCRVWLWRVVASFGAQAGQAYSKTERMYCLYMSVKVSLCCPKSVPVALTKLRTREGGAG